MYAWQRKGQEVKSFTLPETRVDVVQDAGDVMAFGNYLNL
jgi:hypothetical protein